MSRLAAARQISLTQTELESMNQAIQLYDSGKYKSSLKAAEAILAAHPEHPDALAVQALCKSQFPSTQTDSLEIARHAVRNSTRSYLCWHALAICNRKNRHFAEALKAYSHAARIEPRSALMIREVALMSLMLRHHAPVIDLRLQFLRLQPHQRSSWTQLALSHHLAGSLHEAIRVMEEYEAVIKVHDDTTAPRTLKVHIEGSVLTRAPSLRRNALANPLTNRKRGFIMPPCSLKLSDTQRPLTCLT